MIPIDLSKKNVLITGCDRPESCKLVELFSLAGAKVAAQFQQEGNAVKELASSFGRRMDKMIDLYQTSLSTIEEAEDLAQKVAGTQGIIDILVNDINIYSQHSILELTLDEWQESLHQAVYRVFYISKAVSQIMVAKGKGSILNITSAIHFSGLGGGADYAASEAAVHGITLAMARDLAAKGVRVNAIAPERERFDHRNEIGNFAIFLSSSLAEGISGEIFKLEGVPVLKGATHG